MTDLRTAAQAVVDAWERAPTLTGRHLLSVVEAIMQLRAALAAEPAPPDEAPDDSQDWAGMDGATAWHLIDRHAEGWSDIRRKMEAWRDSAVAQARREGESDKGGR